MYSFKTPISINSRHNHIVFEIKNIVTNNNLNSNTIKNLTGTQIFLIYYTKMLEFYVNASNKTRY